MRKNKLAVIIPNWNGREFLQDCLVSLYNQTYPDFEVILVDNGSADGSVVFTEKNFPKVNIIKLKKNYGFAKAINEGVKISLSEYVVFLNNDTSVDKNWLKNLVACAQKHPEVISVNSKLLNFYDRKIIDGVGILMNEVGQARSIGWQELDQGQFEKETYIFGSTGGASLFRRKEFLNLGGFEESYFMYYEEVDFAFRSEFQGYRSIYCPKALVFHKHKSTAKKYPGHVEYWQFRNMMQTIIRDFPTAILLKNFRWLKIILVFLNTHLYQIKNGFLLSWLLTDLWLILHLPKLILQRRKIQSNIKVNISNIEDFLTPKRITLWGLKT